MLKLSNAIVAAALFASACLLWGVGASPEGVWKTFDEKTQKFRGTVRVYQQDGQYFGKIESIVDPKEAAEVCNLCTDDRKNKPVLGLVILRGMRRNGEEYSGGEILDPDTGSVYRCKLKLAENSQKLILRGYIGLSLLGRSQTWLRQQ